MHLSLAIIVKDQASLLAGMLQHHRDLWDEAVVVDTGSRDGSPDVASSLGARVFHFPWCDDFSAARNHALEQARSPWILQLDCDETIDPVLFPLIRDLIRGSGDTCYTTRINNYTQGHQGGDWRACGPAEEPWCLEAPGYLPTNPVRLFPNRADLRFEGVIHENLNADIRRLGLEVRDSGVLIHHTGLLDSQGLERRDQLYDRLLEKKARQAPEDIQAVTDWGRRLVARRQYQQAEGILRRALVAEAHPGQNMHANLMMAEVLMNRGKSTEALRYSRATLDQHAGHHLCWVHAAAASLMAGRPAETRVYLEQGLGLFPDSPALKQLAAKVPAPLGR